MKLKGKELRELLERSVANLKAAERDFILSDMMRMEEAMMALDVENPRMDRALLCIAHQPLFHFNPPTRLLITDKERFMRYAFRCLCTWMQGGSCLADTLLTITAFHYNTPHNSDILNVFILGIWRFVDSTTDLIMGSEVIRREEFSYTSLHSRLPKEAAKAKNGLVISLLQEHEQHDPSGVVRCVKLLLMLLTGVHLGQPMHLLKETILTPLLQSLSHHIAATDDESIEAVDQPEIGVYPLLSNLVTIGCPKRTVKAPISIIHASTFLSRDLLSDLDHIVDKLDNCLQWLLSLPFKTIIGRAVFAVYYQRMLNYRLFYGSHDQDEHPPWRIVGMLLHSPTRQWRLLTKLLINADIDGENNVLLEHWAMLGKSLDLFEPDELLVTSAELFALFSTNRRKDSTATGEEGMAGDLGHTSA